MPYRFLSLVILLLASHVAVEALTESASGVVPGMWGTTDTTGPDHIEWPENWYGARNLRAQWWKIYAESPSAWKLENHAKGEPPGNTYLLWRFDRPVPQGTKLLVEGDFPHARFMDFQVCAPWTERMPYVGDGTGIPEVPLLDADIVPDPGHTNPFLPGADRGATNRHFHVTFELRDGHPGKLNRDAVSPPYRAPGNLRYGCTRLGEKGERGPLLWVRIFLPDGYDPLGGVEPPLIRIQYPGEEPVVAPVVRNVELSLREIPKSYAEADNPATPEGRSVKELESLESLRRRALDGLEHAGKPGEFVRSTLLFAEKDGRINLVKLFGTARFIAWIKNFKDGDFCRRKLPAILDERWGMGFDKEPPANDERVSGHNQYSTYLTGAVSLKPGVLVVFQGKAPRTPRTLSAEPVMESSDELRYWSITLQVGRPMKLTPMISIVDEEVVLDSKRHYTIVLGRAEDRPANASAESGITWREWKVGDAASVLVRYVSTAEKTWRYAPQLIDWDDSDYCDNDRWPHAVREHMGEYYLNPRYLTKDQVEHLGKVGAPPYQIPKDW